MKMQEHKLFQQLVPGQRIEGDWCDFPIPRNMIVGENTVIDSSVCFKQFFSKLPLGIKLGNNITIRSSTLATEPNGYIEIGDYSYLINASIAAYNKIVIGKYVSIAGGVNIVDTDFHPANPADRLADTIALSPVGNKNTRPAFSSYPVIIEDEVWIGFNATILKGVTIGKGAIVQPGAVVVKDVLPGEIVAGNPAKSIREIYA